MEPVLFFVLIAGVIGLLVWLVHRHNEKRRAELAAWAQSVGLGFNRERDGSMHERYPQLEALHRGRNRYAYNIMRGLVQGRRVCAFDYHYETQHSTGKTTTTVSHYFSALVMDSDLELKPLHIRKENLFDKIGAVVGLRDIDFELAEFNREFHVAAEEKRWAYDVLHQESMEFLLRAERFALQFSGRDVIAWRDSTFSPDEFSSALRLIEGLLDRLPRSVVQELGGRR